MSNIWHEKQQRFREYLKLIRNERGLTQSQLAEKLGKPQSFVSKYENGERKLDFLETVEIFEAVGIYDLTDLTQQLLIQNKPDVESRDEKELNPLKVNNSTNKKS